MSNLDWLAGWLEGEGSFHFSETRPTLTRKAYKRIKIVGCSNDLDTLERVQACAGGGRINGPYKYGDEKQNHYQWGLRKKSDVVKLMRRLHPFMGERRKHQISEALKKVGLNP
jgi:hypothetical protein